MAYPHRNGALCELPAELVPGPGAAPLSEWGARFVLSRHGLAEATARLYHDTLGLAAQHFGADRPIGAIARADAAAFRDWLCGLSLRTGGATSERKISEATVCGHIRRMKSVFSRAVDLELIARNPFEREVGTPAAVDPEFYVLSRQDLRRLLSVLPSPGWRCMVALCRLAGLRLGEAMRLVWSEVDSSRRVLIVRPQTRPDGRRRTTTKQRRREVPIDPWLWSVLEEARAVAKAGEFLVCAGLPRHRHNLYRAMVGSARTRPEVKPPARGESGIVGVHRGARGLWRACVGRTVLGTRFPTPEAAAEAVTAHRAKLRALPRAIGFLTLAGLPRFAKPFHSLRKALESEWLAKHPTMTVCKWLGHHPVVAARHYHQSTDAELAAVTGGSAPTPADAPWEDDVLARVQAAWPWLPPAIRSAVDAIVSSAVAPRAVAV